MLVRVSVCVAVMLVNTLRALRRAPGGGSSLDRVAFALITGSREQRHSGSSGYRMTERALCVAD